MCSIHVCTTPSSQWKVEVDGKQLQKGDDQEAVRKLLNMMSDAQSKQERKKQKITKGSVVKVYWPKYLCTRLPENIVLIDTPGYGENSKSTEIVTDSCKKADIIVAVTSIRSPNLDTISSVVKNSNCQCAFGVYTKWDEFLAGKKKQDGRADVEEVRARYEKKYRKYTAIDNEDEHVFFVDVGSVQKIKETEKVSDGGTNDFFNFEKSLAEVAKDKKGKLLKKQAISVILKSEEVFTQFKEIIGKRKETVQGRLKSEISSCESGIDKFKKPEEELQFVMFTEDEIKKLLEEFENGFRAGDTSEKELLEMFCYEVNKKIKETLTRQPTICEEFRKWLKEEKLSQKIRLWWSLPENDVPQLQYRELKNGYYQPMLDPHFYITNNYVWGGLMTGAALASAGAGACYLATRGGLTMLKGLATWLVSNGYFTATGVGGVGGAAGGIPLSGIVKDMFGFGIGDWIKESYPVSVTKINTWKQSLSKELKKIEEESRKLISRQINLIFKEISSELSGVKEQSCREIAELDSKQHDFQEWARELDKCRQALKKIKCSFDELLPEKEDQREHSAFDYNAESQRFPFPSDF